MPNENGGEGEIRTLEWVLAITRFRVVRLQPLGHLSADADTAKGRAWLAQRASVRPAANRGSTTFRA
jgi:hypothetical protein